MVSPVHYTAEDKEVAERLRRVRLELDETQADFAQVMGIATQNYQRAESKNGRFLAGQILRIIRHYNVPYSRLLPRTNDDGVDGA